MRKITYMQAVREAIDEEMKREPNLFMIGEDVGPFGGEMGLSKGLWEKYGDDRLRDAPISEAAIVGCALGAALTGAPAIAEIPFGDFLGVAMDQIYNQVAKVRYMFGGKTDVPLIIRSPLGGYQSAAAQHSQCVEAWFNHIPGIKVVMPSNAYDAKGLFKTCLRDKNPIIFFEHKKLYQVKDEVPEEEYFIPLGQAKIRRKGNDVTVVATAYMVPMAENAAACLEKEGIDVEVIDPRTIDPLDKATIINSVQKTGRLVIVHEAWKNGGIGGEIAAIVAEEAFDSLKAPIKRVAAKDVPIPFSPVLESFVLPSEDKIVDAVKSFFADKK
jgi:pyruvate/2-oxoglutarate/acetoin dehydrogenase E1 component